MNRSENENGAAEPGYVLSVVEPSSRADNLGLQSGLKVLRRRRWTLLLTALLGVGGAYLVNMRMPRIYSSSVTMLLERNDANLGGALDLLDRTDLGADVPTELALMRGRSVMDEVVSDLDLHVRVMGAERSAPAATVFEGFSASSEAEPATYTLRPVAGNRFQVMGADSLKPVIEGQLGDVASFGGIAFTVPEALAAPTRIAVRPFDFVVGSLQRQVAVSAIGRNAEFVELRCRGEYPVEIQITCQSVAENFLDFRRSIQLAEVRSAAGLLQQESDEVKVRLEAAEDTLRMYQAANQGVAMEQRAAAEVGEYAQLSAQRLQLDAERQALSQWIAGVQASEGQTRRFRNLASFPSFIQSSNVSGLMGTLVTLDTERNQLALSRSENNADLQALDQRIASMEAELEGMAVNYEAALSTQISSLDAAMATTSAELASMPTQLVELARLQRQVDGLDEMYRFLEQRLREAEVAEAVDLPGVRIVDPATLPTFPVSPNTQLNLGIGLLLGLCVGVGLAVFREETDDRVREGNDLHRMTDAPILGMLPELRNAGAVLSVERPSTNGNGTAPPVGIKKGKGQRIALEAFRGVVADLRFVEPSVPGRAIRSIAVTSAERGDGKTFTACNLAIAHVEMGVPTLLIDGDARAAGAGRFFGFKPRVPGLTDALKQQVTSEPLLHAMKVEHRSGLTVMPAGTHFDEGTRLVGEEGFAELIRDSVRHYGMTIVDTPPLSILSDAASIARAVDGVLLVVREGSTNREAIRHSLARLERAGARVLGVVLNGSHLPGYYRAYKKYGYGNYGDE